MELWSAGLGKRTLRLFLGEGEVHNMGEGLLIKGTIKEPVWWEYRVTMTERDILDIFAVATTREAVDFVLGSKGARGLYFKLVKGALRFIFLCALESLTRTLSQKPKASTTEEGQIPSSTH